MSKDIDYLVVISINEDFIATSLLSMYNENNKDNEKQGIVTNIEFEFIILSIKKYFFHQSMIDFVHKTEFINIKLMELKDKQL